MSVGRVLHSNVTCTDIIDHISGDMRRNIVANIITNKTKFSILIDESTNLNRLPCLIIYLRTTFSEQIGPVTFFLDIVCPSNTTADGIITALLQCMKTHGLTEEVITDCLIGMGTDGAAVMVGAKSGVVTQMRVTCPSLIGWHCFNHRLELSVHDAVKSCTEINNFKMFLDSVYAVYSMSPQASQELKVHAKLLDAELLRVGRVLDVRWVASSCRTVRAVWQSYSALHAHFSSKCKDPKYKGMQQKLENPVFLKNVALMYDALTELADLSLDFQKADITLPSAHRKLVRQIEVFTARKVSGGIHYDEACAAVKAGQFVGIAMNPNEGREREINRGQFYQALVDSLRQRLLGKTETNLFADISVLDATLLPSTCDISPEHGEVELRNLCQKFGLAFSDVKADYREFKETRGKVVKASLLKLLNRINTIPVSTAECERGFSKMNIVCSSLRSQLSIKHMSSLMFISLNGPPLEQWEPSRYVKSWLAKRRDATCTQCPERQRKTANDDRLCSLWSLI